MSISLRWTTILLVLCALNGIGTAEELVTQLTDPRFPDKVQSLREFTNNKRTFKAYSDQPMVITIRNSGVKEAEMSINGKVCDISAYLKSGVKEFSVDITKYVRNGNDNTLSIQKSQPRDAYLEVYVPYPGLTYGNPEDVGIDPEKLKRVDALITEDVTKGFPGAGVIIVRHGKIVKKTVYGYARKYKDDGKLLDRFEQLVAETLFDMASNTKMFATDFALMQLFAQGRHHYLDPLTKRIPDYKGSDKNGQRREDRLIFDLLTHTAGYLPDPQFFNPAKVPPEEYSQVNFPISFNTECHVVTVVKLWVAASSCAMLTFVLILCCDYVMKLVDLIA